MLRRQFLRLVSVGFALCVGLFVMPLRAASGTPSLLDTLDKGLKARRPEDFNFIIIVVDLVARDILTRAEVMACFDYARRRDLNQPMRYFVPAIKIQAKKAGVNL
ncbi:hypothetical protein LOC68_16370 [Blastopirellula sp. JC732]|uniref:Uncharacterized protein n=1 Tax=Blastopirellula sediminis TaxID=2894196 RepID=A0A9X1SH19_9BACT|nr:hypothetical protein [Blastopirellula sediminis]MCC9606735.1 hypothetical protein [Blastopirellula sediminis]MCC9629968.1 hypothetical protein [Blastopirellula sediminis]